jgi:NADH-quinone oxidoreductase subunit H
MNGMAIFSILVYPGFLFLGVMGMLMEQIDRKLYARLQNRAGPPWYQPLADFIKLLSKEDIIPDDAEKTWFKAMPVLAVAAAATSALYVPIGGTAAAYHFEGDAIVAIYLMTIPTLTFFLGGWYSTSVFSMVGAMRTLTQLYAYEVPLFMAVLSPAIVARSWSLTSIAQFYSEHPVYSLFNIIGFVVALIALQGKLEKVPFDIPEAETEIVGGTFIEYTGRFYAFFRMAISIEMVVGASLIAAVFIPSFGLTGIAGFLLYLVKLFIVLFASTALRTIVARLRIDQMTVFCWKYVAPAALIQLLISIIMNGVLPS